MLELPWLLKLFLKENAAYYSRKTYFFYRVVL